MKFLSNRLNLGLALMLFCILLSACGPSPEEQVATAAALTAAAASQTPDPTVEQLPEPTDTQETSITSDLPGINYGNMEFDGKKRFYMVFVPEGYSDTEPFPLVIYLHSYGWGAQEGMDYTRLNELGDTFGFMIVYPSARPNWNSGIGDNPSWGTPDNNDVGFIDAMLDKLNEDYNIDEKRIYATGYSNGGFMAYMLACQLSHRIAAVASVSGVLSTSTLTGCDPSHSMPVVQIHGTDDGWVAIDGATGWHSVEETLNFWVQENNCEDMDFTVLEDINTSDDSTVEKISYTNCTDNSNIIYYKVINGGHTWPGADLPGYSAGNTNLDFDASFAIWDVFKEYQLPQIVFDDK